LSVGWWKLKVAGWINKIEGGFGEAEAIKWNSSGFNGNLENE